MSPASLGRMRAYFDRIGHVLGNVTRRDSFAMYALGLMGDAERKSVEPIVARFCTEPHRMDAMHQSLLHFTTDARWDDRAVRRTAAEYALDALTQREAVQAWIIDDTGFLKKGSHSVGVQHQYTGSAGKVTNCQIGVSLSIATATEHLPIDFELYLPKTWTDDEARRREARIPDDVNFQTKPQLALDMIQRAMAASIPPGVVLADAAYGSDRKFRESIRALGLHYAVGVDPRTVVWVLNKDEKPSGKPRSVRDLAIKGATFRRCTWRSGTNDDLAARFAVMRVVPAYDDHSSGTSTAKGLAARREHLSLVIEWREGESEPANYFFASVPWQTKTELIRLLMQRWRTERAYEDLKGELGLDHFEGRRYSGWHHHVSVALSCYAFIIAERVRHFPPSARSLFDAGTYAMSP